MKIIIDSYGTEVVFIQNPDGTTLSMAKSTYDELEANLPEIKETPETPEAE